MVTAKINFERNKKTLLEMLFFETRMLILSGIPKTAESWIALTLSEMCGGLADEITCGRSGPGLSLAKWA